MGRSAVEERLAQIDEQVALGERHVAEQRERVAMLERRGADSTEAKKLLTLFIEMQILHVAKASQLRRDLAGDAEQCSHPTQ
jgi:predicted  nucleic acid-binding Zn-ribbon protein